MVYVREAHAADEWRMESNAAVGVELLQPTTEGERCAAAQDFVAAQCGLPFPVAVDRMDDAVSRAYGAWPERLYVIDPQGRVVYQGGYGPFDFHPEEVEAFLRERYGPPGAVRF